MMPLFQFVLILLLLVLWPILLLFVSLPFLLMLPTLLFNGMVKDFVVAIVCCSCHVNFYVSCFMFHVFIFTFVAMMALTTMLSTGTNFLTLTPPHPSRALQPHAF